jgi:hypothetical protein
MQRMVNSQPAATRPVGWERLDALVLVLLVLARIRIDTLAEAAVLPLRQQDVARHPFLGSILSDQAMTLLAQQQLVDPIGLLLIVVALGLTLAYLLVHEFVRSERSRYRVSLALIWAIILCTVFASSLKLVMLRQGSGPASYSHDGGVIQTEAAIDMFLSGRNPYVEEYLDTPMAEWGINEFRTALYHYPYLPWTFIFSAPFKALSDAAAGWYDQRFVYLLLFAVALLLLPGLAGLLKSKLLLVMIVGLNPIMGSDLIFGQNDSFVLAWVVIGLWLWVRGMAVGAGRGWRFASGVAIGLALASKPTAWFIIPFLGLWVAGLPSRGAWGAWLRAFWRAVWPAALAAGLVMLPYVLWDAGAMFDDVWRWSSGTASTAYQIWGWGASNFVLALGGVADRFVYWPFWVTELLIALPVLLALLWRQRSDNTLSRALWGYGIFLLAFFFVSRFLNENYLGYIAAFLALGALVDPPGAAE